MLTITLQNDAHSGGTGRDDNLAKVGIGAVVGAVWAVLSLAGKVTVEN